MICAAGVHTSVDEFGFCHACGRQVGHRLIPPGGPGKIISGGQTGADQGALVGAAHVGIPTGGWMPRGFLTELGPCPDLAATYGLREHPSPLYPPRTRQNVLDANGTIWVGPVADSRGYRRTELEALKAERPFLVHPTAEELREWVRHFRIEILNVAGPRASRDSNAHRCAAELIIHAFGGQL